MDELDKAIADGEAAISDAKNLLAIAALLPHDHDIQKHVPDVEAGLHVCEEYLYQLRLMKEGHDGIQVYPSKKQSV